MTTSVRPAWGWGLATTTTSGDVLDVWYPSPALGAATGDQKRIATPHQAIADGADHIVVGRPIWQAADPRAAAQAIIAEMRG